MAGAARIVVSARRRRARCGARPRRRRPARRLVRRARCVGCTPVSDRRQRARMTESAAPRDTAEHRRLAEATGRAEDDLFDANPWYEWGPYLAERAWGTVREDYSASGDAWTSFPTAPAGSRAYGWNETAWPASPTSTTTSARPCRC